MLWAFKYFVLDFWENWPTDDYYFIYLVKKIMSFCYKIPSIELRIIRA